LRTHKPLAPLEDGNLGTVPLGLLGRIRLDLMLARLAPHDEGGRRPLPMRVVDAVIGGG
jgi:hypothetical protein